MKKVLITGAAGFLGSYLVKELLLNEIRLICIDNMSTGKESNLESILHHPHFTLIKTDISSQDTILLPELSDVDQIYHLASPASPKFYQIAPFETIAANTLG